MKIGILTTFYEWKKSYSLVSVVAAQLNSLLKHGYKPVLFVHDNFKDDDKIPSGVEIRKSIPRFQLVDYSARQPVEKDFYDRVEKVKSALLDSMQDIDVAFTHDWIFQGWYLVYNAGMRKAVSGLKCKWLHWIHSAPSPRPVNLKTPHNYRYSMMPKSKLIYMNKVDTLRLAESYNANIDDVRIVYNPVDPRSFFDFHTLSRHLIDKYDLLSADVIDVYPVSSTRFSGKQVDKVIRIMAKIKEQGRSVRFICCNAHANGDREKAEIGNLISKAKQWGLTDNEVIFTSLEKDGKYEQEVPHKVVKDLFMLSNLFVFPTLSENGPLILFEATMGKNLLVLNESFRPLRDFFGENALYWKFGSLRENVSYEDEDKWYYEVAMIILGVLEKNKPLNTFSKLRKEFNYDYVFKYQLEPILYEKF